jgi:hypothetical protein
MKKITALILKLSLVITGVMIVTNHVGATKRDVETALSLIRQARTAIGGDSSLGAVQSLCIKGTSTRTFQVEGEAERQVNGDFEIALMQPDGLFRIEKLIANHDGGEPGSASDKSGEPNRIFRIESAEKIRMDGAGTEARVASPHQNDEYTRLMIGLLLTAPEKANVTYDYAGEGDVDGARADVVIVSNQNGPVMRLYLDKQSHLPLMMTHQGFDLPRVIDLRTKGPAGGAEGKVIIRHKKDGEAGGDEDIVIRSNGDLPPGAGNGRVMIFKSDGPEGAGTPGNFRVALPAPKEAEIQTRFADYRSVNGVLLPYRMSQSVNGKPSQVMTVTSYEINSPATAERFAPGKIRFVERSKEQ